MVGDHLNEIGVGKVAHPRQTQHDAANQGEKRDDARVNHHDTGNE